MAILAPAWALGAAAGDVEISIQDPAPYHVHPSGRFFSIDVEAAYAGPGQVRYFWRDFRGRRLTEPKPLKAGEPVSVRSPAKEMGYYELVFSSNDPASVLPNRQPGESRAYGFAVLPPRSTADRPLNPASRFGVVHADIEDPYLTGWSKTSTWLSARERDDPHAVAADRWRSRIARRRRLGLVELPLIFGDPWETDSDQPVSAERVELIGSLSKQYFQADPNVRYWEVGLEESLGGTYDEPHYFANLQAKIGAVDQAAHEVNPDIKLIYQIAGLGTSAIKQFLQSEAVQAYDILSLHPYAWPDFPSPEEWMADYLQAARDALEANELSMPIWFTEVGAPHHGNYPGGFFGVPSKGREVSGLTRAAAAAYIIKVHVLALQMGVRKVFWYNYRDRGSRRDFSEHHFGLRDYWGYPKPVYAAYFNLHHHLSGKTPAGVRHLPDGVRVYEFRGANKDCLVVWRYPATDQTLAWLSLRARASQEIVEVTNSVGTPVATAGDAIRITGQPTFIVTRRRASPEGAAGVETAPPRRSLAQAPPSLGGRRPPKNQVRQARHAYGVEVKDVGPQ